MSWANHNEHPVVGPLIAWVAVGVSHYGPLEWMQFVAAIAATVYSIVNIWRVLRKK